LHDSNQRFHCRGVEGYTRFNCLATIIIGFVCAKSCIAKDRSEVAPVHQNAVQARVKRNRAPRELLATDEFLQAAGRSPAEIVGSNPTGGMDICLL